jgi:hypothetical protein
MLVDQQYCYVFPLFRKCVKRLLYRACVRLLVDNEEVFLCLSTLCDMLIHVVSMPRCLYNDSRAALGGLGPTPIPARRSPVTESFRCVSKYFLQLERGLCVNLIADYGKEMPILVCGCWGCHDVV